MSKCFMILQSLVTKESNDLDTKRNTNDTLHPSLLFTCFSTNFFLYRAPWMSFGHQLLLAPITFGNKHIHKVSDFIWNVLLRFWSLVHRRCTETTLYTPTRCTYARKHSKTFWKKIWNFVGMIMNKCYRCLQSWWPNDIRGAVCRKNKITNSTKTMHIHFE